MTDGLPLADTTASCCLPARGRRFVLSLANFGMDAARAVRPTVIGGEATLIILRSRVRMMGPGRASIAECPLGFVAVSSRHHPIVSGVVEVLQAARQRVSTGVVLGVIAIAGGGCGDGNSEATRAVEQRIASERADASRLARQDERIKQLERERSNRRSAPRVRERVVTVPTPPEARTPPPPTPTPTPRGDGGVSGIIAQLGSFRTRASADTEAARLRGRGIDAQVLLSNDYQELRSGYWVVYAGPFGRYEAANDAARRSGVSGAKARPVTPVG